MLNSSAGLLPDGAPVWYAGRVVALEGQQILADVEGPNGKTVRLLLRLQIAFGARRVSGSVQGVPANVDPGLAA